MVAAYPFASDPAAPTLGALMREAADRIELLGDALLDTLATPGVPELLTAKATQGCTVRILIYATHEHLAPLVDQPGVEIRLLALSTGYAIHRFDDDLLLTLDLIGEDLDHAPLIHVRRATSPQVFDRLVEYFGDVWEHDSEPLEPGFDLAAEADDDDDEDRDTDRRLSAPDPPDAGLREPSPPPPRRWPGRGERPRTYG